MKKFILLLTLICTLFISPVIKTYADDLHGVPISDLPKTLIYDELNIIDEDSKNKLITYNNYAFEEDTWGLSIIIVEQLDNIDTLLNNYNNLIYFTNDVATQWSKNLNTNSIDTVLLISEKDNDGSLIMSPSAQEYFTEYEKTILEDSLDDYFNTDYENKTKKLTEFINNYEQIQINKGFYDQENKIIPDIKIFDKIKNHKDTIKITVITVIGLIVCFTIIKSASIIKNSTDKQTSKNFNKNNKNEVVTNDRFTKDLNKITAPYKGIKSPSTSEINNDVNSELDIKSIEINFDMESSALDDMIKSSLNNLDKMNAVNIDD